MFRTYTKVETGTVAELNGKYWGIQYEDGYSTNWNFGPIENAKVSDSKYLKKPMDMTYRGNFWAKKDGLDKAKLRKIKITKTYEVEDV